MREIGDIDSQYRAPAGLVDANSTTDISDENGTRWALGVVAARSAITTPSTSR
jgi:hypothetical protein